MLELRTDCNKCLHDKVCKNRNNVKQAMKKLKNTNIEFSCPDYEERRPKVHKDFDFFQGEKTIYNKPALDIMAKPMTMSGG